MKLFDIIYTKITSDSVHSGKLLSNQMSQCSFPPTSKGLVVDPIFTQNLSEMSTFTIKIIGTLGFTEI